MATAEQAIRARLASDTSVAAIISSKLYPQSAPQGTALPYGIYSRVDAIHEHNMRAASGVYKARVQVDWYAASYSAVIALAEAGRNALQGFRGAVSVGSESVKIRTCHLALEQDGYLNPDDSSQKGIFRKTQDWLVNVDETIPAFN